MRAQMIVFSIGKSIKIEKIAQFAIHLDGGRITWQKKKKNIKVPLKVLRYFPLTQGLQRLYWLDFEVSYSFHTILFAIGYLS